ncbi:hypothetical protein O0L34_g9845 [Tuta absoluta]|nr:hypothetical protein O0L34_g9845 [Tuta absoluta]
MSKTSKRVTEDNSVGLHQKLEATISKINAQNAVLQEQNEKLQAHFTVIEAQKSMISDQKKVIEELSKKIDNLIATVSSICLKETLKTVPIDDTFGSGSGGSASDKSEPALKVPPVSQKPNMTPKMTQRAKRAANRANNKEMENLNPYPYIQFQRKSKATKSTAAPKEHNNIINNTNIIPPTTHDNTNNNNHTWQQALSRKRAAKIRRSMIVGTGSDDSEIQSVERLQFIQAWSFKPETTTENVLSYLNKIAKHDRYEVTKRDINTQRHSAFIIGVPESLFDCVNSPSAWPAGVRLSNWFLIRPRGQRGAGAGRDGGWCKRPHGHA